MILRQYNTVKGLIRGLQKLWSDPKHWVKGSMFKSNDHNYITTIPNWIKTQPIDDNCQFCFAGGVLALAANDEVQTKAMCLIANNLPQQKAYSGVGPATTFSDAVGRIINYNDAQRRSLSDLRKVLAKVEQRV